MEAQEAAKVKIKWLAEDCLPLPKGKWMFRGGLEVVDAEKLRKSLLEDLQHKNRCIYGGVLEGDFNDFVRAYQVSWWLEKMAQAKSRDDLAKIANQIKLREARIQSWQLQELRREYRRRATEIKAGALVRQ